MKKLITTTAVFAIAASMTQGGLLIDNQLLNPGFENWTVSGTNPADNWLQLDGAATAYIDPSQNPISGTNSLITEGDGGTRGQLTSQASLTMDPEWAFRADFAMEDPFVGQDRITTSFQILHSGGNIVMWIRDDSPDDGTAELYLRNPVTKFGDIPGLAFTPSITGAQTSTELHELVIRGHYDDVSPNFDIIFNLGNGSTVSFLGLAHWNGADPVQGDSPTQLHLFGDSFSTGRAKWDNLEFGNVIAIPEPGTLALMGMGIFSLLAFRRNSRS